MNTKCTKLTQNVPTFSNLRPSKIYPNWDFCFEKKLSGNSAQIGCQKKSFVDLIATKLKIKNSSKVFFLLLLVVEWNAAETYH
jgi:hypothetical protein